MHLGDERAGRVHHVEAAAGGVGPHRGCHAVGRKHHHGAIGHLVELLDEDRAAVGQRTYHVCVVHDLSPHVNRRTVPVEHALDDLDRPLDAGAKRPRASQQDPTVPGRRRPLLEHRVRQAERSQRRYAP